MTVVSERPFESAGTGAREIRPTVRAGVIAATVAIVTFVVFSAALDNGFVELDDEQLFVRNAHFRGLGWPQLRWMFTTTMLGHYEPVTWLTHALDFTLWGMDPAGHHFTNLVFHAANAALFYFLARRLLGAAMSLDGATRDLAAAAAALFFALHPLRVESVAWVTERRDVVSGSFFFLTLLFYLQARHLEGRARPLRHVLACGSYLLALLSKPIVMALPVLLVLLDVYPFRRVEGRLRSWLSPALWREKVPYIGLGLLCAMLGYWAEAASGYITSLERVPWWVRPSMVAYSLWFYLSKTIFPLRLAPLYEMPPQIDPLALRFLAPTIVVIGITIVLIALRSCCPAGLTIWASYAVVLTPISGIVHSGIQLAHDRYSYLSCLGFALLVGAGVGAVIQAWSSASIRPALSRLTILSAVVYLTMLALLAHRLTLNWHDNERLWQNAVDAEPDCYMCEVNLATQLLNRGAADLAVPYLLRAREHAPVGAPDRLRTLHHNLGLAFARQGLIEPALAEFRTALENRPDDVPSLMNAGVSLVELRRADEATALLRRAAVLAPNDYLVLTNYGIALVHADHPREAAPVLDRAIGLKPDAAQPRVTRILAALAVDDRATAERHYELLRAIDARAAASIAPAISGLR